MHAPSGTRPPAARAGANPRGPPGRVMGLFTRKAKAPVLSANVKVTTEAGVTVTRDPPQELLKELGVESWSVWECDESTFPWQYSEEETAYLLEGVVTVTPEDGAPVEIKAGDLVTFPQGMACEWEVKEPVRKKYRFGKA